MRSDLEEELLARPDDMELRRVIADRLQEAGDPRGELIAVSCALAAAGTPEERERLSAREGVLLERVSLGIAFDPGAIELEWRLGFVLAATVLDRACELVPALLAHPAARLIEGLTIAVEPEERGAIGAVLAARPRPSGLRWVVVGPPAPSGGWVERAGAEWEAPIAERAPDLDVRPMAFVMPAAYEAVVEDDPEEYVWIDQIAPREGGPLRLPLRRGLEAAMAEVHGTLGAWVQENLPYDPGNDLRYTGNPHAADYPNLRRAIRALAPFVADARISIGPPGSAWIDELAIVRGELRILRGFTANDPGDLIGGLRAYWYQRHLDRPDDDVLRRYVASLYATYAAGWMYRVEARFAPSGADPQGIGDSVRRAIERALSIDDRSAAAWNLRGRFLRATGDLDEAVRCFERAAAVDASRASSFALAITTFTARQDAVARAHLEQRLAAEPAHLGAQVVAAFLAHRAGAPDAARAHLAVLVGDRQPRGQGWEEPIAESRRRVEHQAWEQIVRSGRHAELLGWLAEALAELGGIDAAVRRGAASYLLEWVRYFLEQVEAGRAPEGFARMAERLCSAAADLDPLDGEVHYQWSRLHRVAGAVEGRSPEEAAAANARARGLARATLELALASNPDHLAALADLGIVHMELEEYERAIELLERYRKMSRTPGEARLRNDWDILGQLWGAYYERAVLLAFASQGHPGEAALAQGEAALDGALEVLRERGSREGGEHLATYVLKSASAGFRNQHREALAWADRALAIDDTSPYAWSARALCQKDLGALDDAATSARRAIELDDAHSYAHYLLACVEARRGASADAVLGPLARAFERWPEGRGAAAEEPDLAPVRELPAFRALVGAA